jgi:hypothetical protein
MLLLIQPPVRTYWRGLLCALLLGVSAHASFAQAPGWSRGVQLMNMNIEECKQRARAALETSGYRVDGQGGSYAEDHYFAGTKERHAAAIACDMTSKNYMWINVFVSSTDGDNVAGAERVKLQAQMERPGAVSRGGDDSFSTWTWAYGPPGQELQVNGEVTLYADGRAYWSGDRRTGKWSRSGNRVTIDWTNNNSVDTLYLSADGTVMTGTNRDGVNIRATLRRQ